MTTIFKNPYLNSVYAEVYIILIVTIMSFFAAPDTPDTFFDSIAALSLFVLSASVMGFLFLGQPLQMYLNGEKTQAVTFFMKTVAGFAVLTILAIIVLKVLR